MPFLLPVHSGLSELSVYPRRALLPKDWQSPRRGEDNPRFDARGVPGGCVYSQLFFLSIFKLRTISLRLSKLDTVRVCDLAPSFSA